MLPIVSTFSTFAGKSTQSSFPEFPEANTTTLPLPFRPSDIAFWIASSILSFVEPQLNPHELLKTSASNSSQALLIALATALLLNPLPLFLKILIGIILTFGAIPLMPILLCDAAIIPAQA